jgi:hypothetical protein
MTRIAPFSPVQRPRARGVAHRDAPNFQLPRRVAATFAPLSAVILWMPRRQRIWVPGDILGIVGRGHEGRPIFVSDDDRGFFAERLGRFFVPGGRRTARLGAETVWRLIPQICAKPSYERPDLTYASTAARRSCGV